MFHRQWYCKAQEKKISAEIYHEVKITRPIYLTSSSVQQNKKLSVCIQQIMLLDILPLYVS